MQSPAMFHARRLGVLALAICLLSLTGCLQETTNGDETYFTYPMWLSALFFVVGAITTVVGYFLLPTTEKAGYFLLVIGPVLVFGFTPSYFFYKTTVGPEEFHSRHGFLGMGSVHVKYAELTEIKLTFTLSRRSRSYYLDCKTKDDKELTLRLNDEGQLAAAPLFIRYARAKNVPILGPNGDPIVLD